MKIGIIPNLIKDIDLKVTKQLYNWLKEKQGIEVLFETEVASLLNVNHLGYAQEELFKNCYTIIVLGGDGTLLSVAREAALFNVPLFGINLGHLGFLTESEVGNMYEELDKLLKGEYTIEKRMMLQAFIEKDNIKLKEFIALNDISLTRGPFTRILSYKVFVDDDFVDYYSADGLIVSSPTGSTAYSLSAGGPIVSPEVKVLIITPICPHTLHSKSIITSEVASIKVEICSKDVEVMVSADGQKGFTIHSGDTVTIKKSNFYTSLIKLKHSNFYEVLREKFSAKWNYKV